MKAQASDLHHWVEADRSVKNPDKLIGYSVWHYVIKNGETVRRECVQRYSIARSGGWQVALYRANALRDDLNGSEANAN